MKKRFTCAIVLAFTTDMASAAVTMFEKSNLTYKLSADLQIQLQQDSGIDEELKLEYDDGELKNRFEYELGNAMKGFGQLDFEVAKDSNVTLEEAYVGLAKGNMSFFIGNSNYASDGFGVEKNIDVGDVEGDAFLIDGSDEVLGFSYETDRYSASLSHDLEVDDDESSTDLLLAMELQGVELELAFQTASNIELESASGTEFVSDAETFGLSISYSLRNYEIAAAYSSVNIDVAPDSNSTVHVAASVAPWTTTKINVGYEIVDVGEANTAAYGLVDSTSWYLNAIYRFPEAKGFRAFVELGETDYDGASGIDVGFLTGLRLVF